MFRAINSEFNAKMIESTDLSRIDFIITYHEEPDDVEPLIQREIFLHNLRINGLKLQLKSEINFEFFFGLYYKFIDKLKKIG